MDVSQYLEIFIDETKEHLQTLSDQLMILETEPDNMETINEIFRGSAFFERNGWNNGLQENAAFDA